jgi:hypothetical protein
MHTAHSFNRISPSGCLSARILSHKKLWLRVNRVLAWSLIVSPVLQIMLGSALVPSLILDLVILLVHGGLSVWLFGQPKSPTGDDGTMHWIGISEAHMTQRNRFLLSGWRLMLSTLYLLGVMVLAAIGSALPDSWNPDVLIVPISLGVILIVNFFGLMWPYAAVTHVYGASGYALRRWGAVGGNSAVTPWASALIVLVFMALSIANVLKTFWS